MKRLRYISLLVTLFMGYVCGYAQNTPDNQDFVKAYNCIYRGSTDSAKTFIDKALSDSNVRKNAVGWYVRGFIYKDLYKKNQGNAKQDTYRDTAIADLLASEKIDTTQKNRDDCSKIIKFLAISYYNDAGSLMDSLHYATAIEYYNRCMHAMNIIEKSGTLNAMRLSFHLKLGEVYSYLFFHAASEKQRKAFFDSAKNAYNVVLAINPNDVSGNYSLAVLYYNQAVTIINQMDFDADLTKLNAAQDTSVNLAKQSLPYMEKTYQLDPKKKDAIKGLEGIYYLLHDTQKFDEYEQKLKELESSN